MIGQGNENNFRTMRECHEMCEEVTTTPRAASPLHDIPATKVRPRVT